MPATVLWHQRESLYDLMVLRAAIGHAAFNAEKQGDPQDPSLCEWPAEYLQGPGFWFDEWPNELEIKTLSLDPSKGKDQKRGDYSAYVRLGRDKRRMLYVEADLRRDRDGPKIVADGVEHVKDFKPDGFAIEVNQFQELFVAEFLRVGTEQGVDLPIYPIENMVNKNVRIRRIGPYLAQRRMRFKARSPGTMLLVDQLKQFPNCDHDDGIDSAEMALRLMVDLVNGRLTGKGPQRVRSG